MKRRINGCLTKQILSSFGLATIFASQQSSAATGPLNVPQFIAQQAWTPYAPRSVALPSSEVAVVTYFAKGATAPSCGLLTQASSAPEFIEILSPEPGAGFPQCLTINDVAQFELDKKKYLVFEYINRDTKEDFYREYFYVYKDAAGHYVADKELNNSAAYPESVRASANGPNPPRAKDGVKRAKGTLISKIVPSMSFLARDFLLDDTRAFAVFQDKAKEKCNFVLDSGTKPAIFGHEIFSEGDKCSEILASSKLDKDGKTYYLAMFKGAAKNRLAVISVNKENAIVAEKDAAIATTKHTKLTDMKSAKTALLTNLK